MSHIIGDFTVEVLPLPLMLILVFAAFCKTLMFCLSFMNAYYGEIQQANFQAQPILFPLHFGLRLTE
jgi:hypothetical protein